MKDFLYLERVEYMLNKLLKNEPIKTSIVAEYFDVDDSVIRKDLRERIKPLFPNTIKKVNNAWVADKDLIENQFFSADELLIISLLNNVTKDLNPKFYDKTLKLFRSLHKKASYAIFEQPSIENIVDTHEREFHMIKNAIENKKELSFKYYGKKDKLVHPLKIANLEHYWYLIAYDLNEDGLRTFYFKEIREIDIKEKEFNLDEYKFIDKLNNAINAFFRLEEKIDVELELSWSAYTVLKRKKLNPSQYIIWDKEANNASMYITVSHLMEIAPLIQQWIPHIYVKSPPELEDLIMENLNKYQFS